MHTPTVPTFREARRDVAHLPFRRGAVFINLWRTTTSRSGDCPTEPVLHASSDEAAEEAAGGFYGLEYCGTMMLRSNGRTHLLNLLEHGEAIAAEAAEWERLDASHAAASVRPGI